MPLGFKHFTEPTTKAERSEVKAEQEQWRALDKRVAELEEMLTEWCVWNMVCGIRVKPDEALEIIRGSLPMPPGMMASDGSLTMKSIRLLQQGTVK